MQNLSAMLPTSDVLPATRGWAASPDLLLVLVDLVITGGRRSSWNAAAARPRCGSP